MRQRNTKSWSALSGDPPASVQRRRLQRGAEKRAQVLASAFDELSELEPSAAAEELNRRDVKAPAGGKWHAMQVVRIRKRLKAGQRRAQNITALSACSLATFCFREPSKIALSAIYLCFRKLLRGRNTKQNNAQLSQLSQLTTPSRLPRFQTEKIVCSGLKTRMKGLTMSATIRPFRPRANATPVNTGCEAEIIDFPQPAPAEEETPFYELPAGPNGCAVMYERPNGWALIDGVLPPSVGWPVTMLILQSCAENGKGDYLPHIFQPEQGGNMSIDACVPKAVAHVIIDRIQPPPTAA